MIVKLKKIYNDAIRIKILNIDNILFFYNFLNIFQLVNIIYMINQKTIIEYKIKKNQKLSTIKDLIKNYQNYFKLTKTLIKFEKIISHLIFATLQNQKLDNSKYSDKL